MVSSTVFVIVNLASLAVIGGAFYAQTFLLARRIESLETRFETRFDRLESDVAGLKAAVAIIESRLDG